jgi:hypothetical protein
LTSWNVFSHLFFVFFELWPLTSWNVFSHHFSVIREIKEWAEMGEWAKASIKKKVSTESHRIIISFISFIFHRIQQETLKNNIISLHILHFSSHLTRTIKKTALFPLFSSFFIKFNKKH